MHLNVYRLAKMFLCSVFLINIFFALWGQNQSKIQNIQQAEETKTDVLAPVAIPVLTPEQAQEANDDAILHYRKQKIEKLFQKLRFAIVLLPLLAWLALVYKGAISDSNAPTEESIKNE